MITSTPLFSYNLSKLIIQEDNSCDLTKYNNYFVLGGIASYDSIRDLVHITSGQRVLDVLKKAKSNSNIYFVGGSRTSDMTSESEHIKNYFNFF